MDAIDLLREQHEEVKQLLEQLEEADSNDAKQALFEELADKLSAHSTIEENIFYPAAYATKTRKLLAEAVEEHLAMKRILAELMGMSPDQDDFAAKIENLKEQVDHHIEEEEGDLFGAVRKELTAKVLNRMGQEMKDLFDDEMAGTPREAILYQVGEAAPPR